MDKLNSLPVLPLFLLFSFCSGQIVTVPRSDCTWRGGDFGDTTSCSSGEVAVGSCGSGSDPDCSSSDDDGDYYDMLYCCELSSSGSIIVY